jgi:hypothetical protein
MARRSAGLRGRLDRLEGNAHQTMNTAQGAIAAVREAALGLLEELQDGVEFELEIAGRTMPVKLRMIAREESID